MKKILIAGGGGYVGTELSLYLANKGYNITVLDPFWFGNYLPEYTKNLTIKYGSSLSLTENDISDFSVIIFIGGLSNDPMAEFSPKQNFIHNLAAPVHLAYITEQSSKKHGVKRFIFASSCSVYGFLGSVKFTEDSQVSVNSPYGLSKKFSDMLIMDMQSDTFKPICFRKGTIGGFSRRMRFDLLINTMVKTAFLDKEINVNSPDLYRPIIDIRDVLTAYEIAINAENNITGIFNILHKNYQITELAEIVHTHLLHRNIENKINILNKMDIRSYCADNTKAISVLNFHTKHDIESTIDHIIDNFDFKNADLNKNIYYNIKVFQELYI